MKNVENNGEIMEVFFKEGYSWLPMKNTTVFDIGTNIADTAIYFAKKGAKKIIALEPFPKNYEIAKNNVEINKLSNKIDVILAGLSDQKGHIKIDAEKKGMFALEASDNGDDVPLMTLEQLLEQYEVDSAVLKMDCENCEYTSILSASNETLQKFTHIQIEYHDGFQNIKERLEKAGFDVSLPSAFSKNHTGDKTRYLGYLLAKLK